MRTPAEMEHYAEDAAFGKATNTAARTFLLGLTGGAFIALGFIFYVTSQTATAEALPWGAAKVIGGVVFATGLVLVVLTGAELFTSSTLTMTALASRRITGKQFLSNWCVVYVSNAIGAFVVVLLIFFGGTWHQAEGQWGATVLHVAAAKLSHSWLEAFCLGILCNIAVCIAVWVSYAGRTAADKTLVIILPIALFVAAGFEHSVANMFLIPLAIMISRFAGSDFWVEVGLDQADFAEVLTWPHFLAGNLVPVTLGNIVGGGVMVGLLYWTIYHLPATKSAHLVDR